MDLSQPIGKTNQLKMSARFPSDRKTRNNIPLNHESPQLRLDQFKIFTFGSKEESSSQNKDQDATFEAKEASRQDSGPVHAPSMESGHEVKNKSASNMLAEAFKQAQEASVDNLRSSKYLLKYHKCLYALI